MNEVVGESAVQKAHASAADGLPLLAEQTLAYCDHASTAAEAELAAGKTSARDAFASVNTLTSLAAHNLTDISEDARRNLEAVVNQPAIARVETLNEAGELEVYFITPGGAPRGRWGAVKVASYHSPMGRLASMRPGKDVDIATPTGLRSYEIIGRAQLHPGRDKSGWDSRDTVVEALTGPALTIVSLRALLRLPVGSEESALAMLELALQAGVRAQNVFEGIRRTVLERIGIRARPVLDECQDNIFRLPLNSRIAILGPPGSGKTTTLIKRLGLKLDVQALDEDVELIKRTLARQEHHRDSWLMFSPTELLRLYVREAFNRERVPAADHQVQAWDPFRRDVARNRLGVLRSANAAGATLREDLKNLQPATVEGQIAWFEDFDRWQKETFWAELQDHARRLKGGEPPISSLAARIMRIIEVGAARGDASPFVEFRVLSREVGDRAAELASRIDLRLRTAFALQMKAEPALLTDLSSFVRTLGEAADGSDESDDLDVEEDEEEVAASARAEIEQAFDTYLRAVRAQARALANGRRLGPRTRYGKVVEWLGARLPLEDELKEIGATVMMAASLQRLANPMRSYLNGVRARYGRFRRLRQAGGVWYGKAAHAPADLGPLELDAILLAMLRSGRMLLANPRIAGIVDESNISSLQAVRGLFRTQILVDEATDFSPLQLACMAALCDPATNSFLASGDFNQRITLWGVRSEAELRWVLPDIDIRTIRITYRHSRQLNALAHDIARLGNENHEAADLPDQVDTNGVAPVYCGGLAGAGLARWLADRICEIERLTKVLPSVAVLVNGEDKVQPLAERLQLALTDHNIQCAACPGGLVKGNEGDVRVFDVQHIKGLEFEAVFFIGVDELAALAPALFDKFLYVGATRAAMYLGLTSASPEPPPRLSPVMGHFGADWLEPSGERP